jgi:hypothetical protein
MEDHLGARTGEVQRDRGHAPADVVDVEDEVVGQVRGIAPHHPAHAGIDQPELVTR